MITLAADCLLFRLAGGESIPFSAEMISVEMMGESAEWFDPEFVQHAAKAVFHYFKAELGRQTVTVGEFAGALEKVLRGFKLRMPEPEPMSRPGVLRFDLALLAGESSQGWELFFFPRLRKELRQQMQQAPHLVRFHGLRRCVKTLVGARRWSLRCQDLEDQIVAYLRQCLNTEPRPPKFSMVVE
jgi:hypothetical protein